MSKKDYIRIAYALYLALENATTEEERAGVLNATAKIGSELKDDNYRFDRSRFEQAVRTGATKGGTSLARQIR
jgi:hypothetical protein